MKNFSGTRTSGGSGVAVELEVVVVGVLTITGVVGGSDISSALPLSLFDADR